MAISFCTTSTKRSFDGFTLIEILVVVAVLAILAGLFMPTLQGMLSRAAEAKCVSNLKTISGVSALFSADHNGDWPPSAVGTVFANSLIPYLGRVPGTKDADFLNSPLICPAARTDAPDGSYQHRGFYILSYTDPDTGKNFSYGLSYAQNPFAPGRTTSPATQVRNRLAVENASKMMLYMDFYGHYMATLAGIRNPASRDILLRRHKGRINAAYVDGSVRGILYEEIPTTTPPTRMFWSGRGKTWPD